MNGARKLAGLEYVGLPGVSQPCLVAIHRYIQFGDRIESALVLSFECVHAFLLKLEGEQHIAVKTGFSSGYLGEGPRTFAEALRCLDEYGVDIDECIVRRDMLDRLDKSALTERDMDAIRSSSRVRPKRWYGYVHEAMEDGPNGISPWRRFPEVIPWSLIDPRIVDLAKRFFIDPDGAILTGFRRLEDLVRARTKLDGHGARLFSQAFLGESSRLCWEQLEASEQSARGTLFTATFSAFRNPRAHKESAHANALAEFLALNQLFLLESTSVLRSRLDDSGGGERVQRRTKLSDRNN